MLSNSGTLALPIIHTRTAHCQPTCATRSPTQARWHFLSYTHVQRTVSQLVPHGVQLRHAGTSYHTHMYSALSANLCHTVGVGWYTAGWYPVGVGWYTAAVGWYTVGGTLSVNNCMSMGRTMSYESTNITTKFVILTQFARLKAVQQTYVTCHSAYISNTMFIIFVCSFNLAHIFTALHGMQTRSSDENSVRLSIRHTREL